MTSKPLFGRRLLLLKKKGAPDYVGAPTICYWRDLRRSEGKLHHAAHTAHSTHAAHVAATLFFLLRKIGDEGFGREKQTCDA